jgi:hypothetical protein
MLEDSIVTLNRLNDSSKEEARLQDEIKQAWDRAYAAKQKGDRPAESAALTDEQAKEQELATLRQLNYERAQKTAEVMAKLRQAATDGGNTEADIDGEIQQKKADELEITTLIGREKVKALETEQQIRAALEIAVGLEERRAKALAESAVSADKLRQALPPAAGAQAAGAAAPGATPDVTASLNSQADAAKAAQGAAESSRSAERSAALTASAATDALKATQNLGTSLSQALQAAGEALKSLVITGQEMLKAANLFPQVTAALKTINDNQALFGAKLGEFGNVVLDKFGETATSFQQHAKLLAGLSAAIQKIEISKAADVDLAAQGLPG